MLFIVETMTMPSHSWKRYMLVYIFYSEALNVSDIYRIYTGNKGGVKGIRKPRRKA